MATYTQNYRLGYFKRGGRYSGEIDYRRFVTLDYNLDSYVGIVGVGVISGWTIEATDTPLQVKILPGNGMINGFYSESEYGFKQRSAMVSGEREVEIVEDDNVPEPALTASERAAYIAIRQEYEPTYYNPDPGGPIINYYIKTVIPYVINLPASGDIYITASRKFPDPYDDCFSSTAYVPPPTVDDKPLSASFTSYASYKAALDAYNVQREALRIYQWRAYTENRFTSVVFDVSSVYIKNASSVLLGKVVTRNGIIKKIDTKQVDNLENLQASIKTQAKPYIAGHIHGGSDPFDPQKIQLKTDFRDCALATYKSEGQVYGFDILEGTETSVDVGHKHTYKVDGNGDGYTVEVIGTNATHFHKISKFVVGTQEYTINVIQSHSHTIATTSETIDPYSPYVVYVDDVPVTNNVTVDFVKKQILIYGLIGDVYKTYYSEFPVTVYNNGTASVETYKFEKSAPSVFSFMLKMQLDFGNKYTFDQIIIDNGSVLGDVSGHPFYFVDGSGLSGVKEIQQQSLIAQTLLNKIGDTFTFTPNAARNVTVLYKDSVSAFSSKVKIEILGNTEVSGVLKDENIAFISAEKFKLGIFDIARIPPLNHMGRMGEEFLPFQYPMVSTNGIEYAVSPAITTDILDHYHQLQIDESLDGSTNNTYVAEDPVYYAYSNGVSYLIAHDHGVQKGVVLDGSARDLSAWQQSLHGTNVSSTHTHEIIKSVKGDPKVIYSLAETPKGSILAGTSSGLYIIPYTRAYLFVINGVPIYEIGNDVLEEELVDDLWNMFIKAGAEYSLQTGKQLVITEDQSTYEYYQDKITKASLTLEADGDSTLMLGYIDPIRGQDQIMLQRTESFLLPYFRYKTVKILSQVTSDEIILNVKMVFEDGTEVTETDINEAIADGTEDEFLGSTAELATVEKDLHEVPIWSIITDDQGNVFVCGATEYSQILDIENSLYSPWSYAPIPNYASSLRKIYKDSQNNIWMPTEKGLMVARNYQNATVIESTNNSGFSVNVYDTVEGVSGKIYIADDSGINFTTNGGKTWTSSLAISGGFARIMKDASTGYIYAISNFLKIYRSIDGTTWESVGSLLQQEVGDVIAYNGYLYACTIDGLYRSLGGSGSWDKVLVEAVYSIGMFVDGNGIIVGGNQSVYVSTDGESFTNIFNISGSAAPSLYTQNIRQNYGYAYGNKNQQFFFKGLTYSKESTSSLVDFSVWMAKQGTWDANALCDIYIDRELIYSSKRGIDKRVESNYLFEIDPMQGTLNFGAQTTLTKDTEVFDEYISVSNSSSFGVGDRVYIVNTADSPTKPSRPDGLMGLLNYFDDLVAYYDEVNSLENMLFYAEVSGVASGRIFLDKNIDVVVTMPANVYKIPNLTGSTPIFANIYESMLSNAGTNTHEDLDDITTYASDNRPYQLNNSYLSNLLQLTQAMKYAFPDINTYMPNTKFFDFRYSWDPNDPNRPYIGDIVDLYSCEAYNEGLYDSDFLPDKSKMVNKILVGHGSFANMIFVATDIGIFYAKLTESLEANWFYEYTLVQPVYDLLIYGENTLLAATVDGVYSKTVDGDWVAPSQPAILFPVYTFHYRWTGRETITTLPHTATFSNENGRGKITTGSTPYGGIQINRIIKVSIGTPDGPNEKDGLYSVEAVSDNEIIVREAFSGSTATYTNVVVEMGAWWEYLSGDVSTNNTNIKNTIMAGGRSMIAYATNVTSSYSTNDIVWRQSDIPVDLPQFSTANIAPLTNGSVLAAISSVDNNAENDLLVCTGSGAVWERFKDFKAVKGTILGRKATEMGHTTIKVSYTFPTGYQSEDYSLNLKEIGFFNNNDLVLKSYVCSNEIRNGSNYITVYGQDLFDAIGSNPNLTFVVYPIKINKIIELENHNVFYGTDRGLFFDDGSTVNFAEKNGDITKVGNGGIVTKIDVNGTIMSISSNPVTKNVVINISTSDSITSNQLVGNTLYVVDLTNPISYKVISNSSLSTTGEVTIELDVEFDVQWRTYKGKNVTVVGKQSKVYVTFDSPVTSEQFNGGTIYVSSNENNNIGKEYKISTNTSEYLVLSTPIVPKSSTTSNNDSLIVGQSIKMLDATSRIKLYVNFQNPVETNQFAGFNFRIEATSGAVVNPNIANINMTVYSNTPFEIVLNPVATAQGELPAILSFNESTRFALTGNWFSTSTGFANKMLDVSSDHYHAVALIGQKLSGIINTISTDGSAYMDITIDSPDGFSNPVLLADGSIIDNCKVILYNPKNMAYSYETTSVSYVGGILKLRISNSNLWDITAYNELKISTTWAFSIEAQYSGSSVGTYYQDFGAILQYLTEDSLEGNADVYISSTAGIVIGDKIELFDGDGRSFVSHVANIVSATQIELDVVCDNSYLVNNGAGIKVLRDAFANNHTHVIKDTQVQTMTVTDYLDLGYPSTHSHKLSPYILDVADLTVYSDKFLAVGSSESIYVSYNSGGGWSHAIDLNKSLEWDEEITGVSRIISPSGKIIVGTTNGQIFSNTTKGWIDIPLETP